MEWQPIETAPKDEKILLARAGQWVDIGEWEDDRHAKKPRPYWTANREWWAGKMAMREQQPTHWMPLPPPPKG